ncbi:MAG: hypothetical protein IJF33_02110 [Clostridia bacterium]|nr:hypothetical protein [Clostridia bacterium]
MKKWIALSVCLLLLLSLVSCTEEDKGDAAHNASVQSKIETVIDAILANDSDAAYALFSDVLEKEAFQSFFENVREYLKDVETYELEQTEWNEDFSDGVVTYTATFKMITNGETYWVDAAESSKWKGLVTFNIVSDAERENQWS